MTPDTILDAANKAATNGGARRISSRRELRECVVADACAGLLTPDGEYVLAAPCWSIGAETREGTREFGRGRTVVTLPVAG